MKIKLIVATILVASSSSLLAQKIKYKDLFPILEAKNWTEGGPQLRTFLSDPKNAEAPNANLQLALMLEDRFKSLDVVSDTVASIEAGDSAVFFFEKAKGLITEKELKKNDKYYQSFFRRDLRTGEFGIKVSDVHLDIEKKVEAIEKRLADSRAIYKSVRTLERDYAKARELYMELTSDYKEYGKLLLGANDEARAKLQEIKSKSMASKNAADQIQQLSSQLKSNKFQNEISLKPIVNYGTDGASNSDFNSGKLELWDYETWTLDTNSEINGSIGLLKTMVTNYANDIREKKKVIKTGRDAEVDTLSKELIDLFEKYESESVAKKLLMTETSEVLIMKQVDISINQPLQDSALIGAQLEIFQAALKEAEKMSLNLESINLDEVNEAKNYYPDYINSFFQTHGTATNYVTEMKTWVNRQKEWLGDAVEFWTEKNRWGIVINEEDQNEMRIPLFLQDAPETQFYTIGMPIYGNEEIVVYGANISDKKGFVYSFGENRNASWGLEFELPGSDSFQFTADTIPSDNNSISFYLLNSAADENNLSVVSFSQSGSLNWNATVTVPKPPVDFKFDNLTQELTILLYPEEQLPLDNDELGYLVIDRTGNAR